MYTTERQTPAAILKDVFGYHAWRPLQREIIENVLAGRDTLAILPTGAGKSLCYQIPALLFAGLTVVVSPLISLMKDQLEQLSTAGVAAVVLNSSLTDSQYRAGVRQVAERRARLLYVAPETLLLPRTRDLLAGVPIAALVIDEAHCISEWGHDFRPEYRQLVTVRQQFPRAVCLALTATATPRVQQDIMDCLHFAAGARFLSSFDRANLFLEVAYRERGIGQAVEFIDRFRDQAGIVYCLTRNQVDRLSADLAARHFSVRPYHAGLAAEVRQANQEAFIHDDVRVIVATVAFGMGINKPDVRFILHHHLPLNIEGYYQQIGRAGRDGLPAHCLLLYNHGDAARARTLIDGKEMPERDVAGRQLEAMLQLAETRECRRIPLLAYFGETYGHERCAGCDNCRRQDQPPPDLRDGTRLLLDCVRQTGEIFGAVHVVNVLRGGEDEKVLRFGHHRLPCFASGSRLERPEWAEVIRAALKEGLLRKAPEYGSLKLTSRGEAILLGEQEIPDPPAVREKRRIVRPSPTLPADDERLVDHGLFEALRQLRKSLADQHGIPAYAIFPDKSLLDMAARMPLTKGQFRTIHGVGKAKMYSFASPFLRVIREYCRENEIVPEYQTMAGEDFADSPC